MPKPALAALLIVAAVAVAALLILSGSEPGDTGLGETANTAPVSTHTATAGSDDPTPLQPATVSTAAPRPPANTAAGTPGGPGTVRNGGATGRREVAQGERISGVVRAPGGVPAVGAQVVVTVQGAGGPMVRSVRTDVEGRFEVEAPGAGRATVQVSASGLATVAAPVTPGTAVEMEPPPAVEVRGVVRDGQGTPLPGAFVTAQQIGAPVTTTRTVAQTDPNGEFRIGALQRDARYTLQATHPSRAPSEPLEVTAPAAGAVLTLYEGATLVVKVLDADGAPLPSPLVKKSTVGGWQSLSAYAEVHGPGGSRTLSNWTASDPTQITLTGLPPGEFRVALQARGHGKAEINGITVPRTGQVETEVRLTRGGEVVVTVLDAQGAPMAGAIAGDAAQVGSPFGLLVQMESGSEGQARVGPLAPGKARIQVTRPGYVTVFADVLVQAGIDVPIQVTLKKP
ncbi:MAG: carboxypeptidase-like regulatory domain-containing protein [Planctomycetota bacterium]